MNPADSNYCEQTRAYQRRGDNETVDSCDGISCIAVSAACLAAPTVAQSPSPSINPPSASKSPETVVGIQTVPQTPPLQDETFFKRFAEKNKLSLADSRAVFADTKALADYTVKNGDDPGFGSLWTTYLGGYRIHLRVVNDQAKQGFVTQLEVLPNVSVQVGGKSNSELRREADALHRVLGSRAGDTYIHLDVSAGVVIVEASATVLAEIRPLLGNDMLTKEALIRPAMATSSPGEGIQVRPAAGYVFQDQGCTVGFTVRRLSDNWPGVVSAGHCARGTWNPGPQDWTARTQGLENFWEGEQWNCGPDADSQIFPTTGNTTSAGDIWQVAGGRWPLRYPACITHR